MRLGDEVGVNRQEGGNGWLEKEENGRVFQEARGEIAASMTPGHEA